MFRLFSRWRLAIYAGFLSLFSLTVYLQTKSLGFAVAAMLGFLLVNILAIYVLKYPQFRVMRATMLQFGEMVPGEVIFPMELIVRGIVFFRNKPTAGRVVADPDGVYFHKAFVCSVLVSWENIEKVVYHDLSGVTYAQLFLVNGADRNNDLLVPWRAEFRRFAPV